MQRTNDVLNPSMRCVYMWNSVWIHTNCILSLFFHWWNLTVELWFTWTYKNLQATVNSCSAFYFLRSHWAARCTILLRLKPISDRMSNAFNTGLGEVTINQDHPWLERQVCRREEGGGGLGGGKGGDDHGSSCGAEMLLNGPQLQWDITLSKMHYCSETAQVLLSVEGE